MKIGFVDGRLGRYRRLATTSTRTICTDSGEPNSLAYFPIRAVIPQQVVSVLHRLRHESRRMDQETVPVGESLSPENLI